MSFSIAEIPRDEHKELKSKIGMTRGSVFFIARNETLVYTKI